MCHPTCRDPRTSDRSVAVSVAATVERKRIRPAQVSAFLADRFGVERFADLCHSHAAAVDQGLRKSVLADDIRAYPAE